MPLGRRRHIDRRRICGEAGSTLVELLAATAIMGIAVVGLLVGSSVTWQTSSQNRTQTTAGIVARDYAESLSESVASGAAWCNTTAAAYGPAYTVPSGYTVTTSFGTCPVSGAQFQTATITVTSGGDTETLKTVLRQP